MKYEIKGDDMQMLEIELAPKETIIAEAGAMTYMEQGIEFEAKMGDGSKPDQGMLGKLMDAGKRVMSGESLFMTHFTQAGSKFSKVCFSAPHPGKIMVLDLAKHGGEILCQKDSFLCATHGIEVGIAFTKRLRAGFFGGEGFILQRIKGKGTAFVHAGGMLIEKELNGEVLRVDTGCLVGFTPGIQYDIQTAGNLKSMLFAGEGMFLATLQGKGTVWLQSLPISRLADRIHDFAPAAGGKAREEGSILGGIGRLIDGN